VFECSKPVGPFSQLRSFRVVLPNGQAYWTVVDGGYAKVEVADRLLFDLRFGHDRAESTSRMYAGEPARFLSWCVLSGRSLEDGAGDLSRFVLALRTTPTGTGSRGLTPRPETEQAPYHQGGTTMTENLPAPTERPRAPQLRITVAAEVPDEPEQEYTAVEMLLALTNGLRLRGVTPSLLHLEITPPRRPGAHAPVPY
jgi:hypothetical protein